MQNIAAFQSALPVDVPEWVHLVPDGVFKGVDGRGPYRLVNPAAVIAASMAGGKLPIDENHATDLAGPQGQPSPARGWIVEMQARADGIWGRVEWTASGRALLEDAAYRGVSPVFTHSKSGEVQLVLRAALTNTPNLGPDLTALNHQDVQMDLTRMRVLLGLPAEADAATVTTALEAHMASATALQAQVTSLQAAAIKPETVVALQTRVAELEGAQRRAAAVTFVDAAIAAGKPIAALRDHYVARHMADAASVEKEVAALVSINAGGVPPGSGGGQDRALQAQVDDLDADTMSIIKRMGVDPKKYAEQFKKKAA